jgi:hypothetical protein
MSPASLEIEERLRTEVGVSKRSRLNNSVGEIHNAVHQYMRSRHKVTNSKFFNFR